jgi:peptidoglycan/xylan/chitin deacetylase (PgdA/CDA1 family)
VVTSSEPTAAGARGPARRRLTIVMYHFVRDLERSRYPAIKGLDTRRFVGQLDYVLAHYQVVRMEDVLAALDDPGAELPPRALLLTFDDGYADHYQTVFPILDRLGLQGSFFAPARAILERRVLDVNKIHFVLAGAADPTRVAAALEAQLDAFRGDHELASTATYRARHAHANRWDPAEVIYVKRMLQKGLPEAVRAPIADALFRTFVTADEAAFAEELYLSLEQLRCMRRHGMHVGSHSHDHLWLDTLTETEQRRQVVASVDFLRVVGCDLDAWTMCYPYGGFDASLLAILGDHGCRLGLTTELALADLDAHHRLTLPRIDTNDLPDRPDAEPVAWTLRAGAVAA